MPSALDRFRKPGAAPAAGGARPPAKKHNRWAGYGSSEDRDPYPWTGEYLFRVESGQLLDETVTYKQTLEVVEVNLPEGSEGTPGTSPTKVGDRVVFTQKIGSKEAERVGVPKIKRYVMSVAGFEDLGAFATEEEERCFLDATAGDLSETCPVNPLIGRLVHCIVSKGNPVLDKNGQPTGDFYRNHKWTTVPDEYQTPAAAAQ